MKISISATQFAKGDRVIARIDKDEWYAGTLTKVSRDGKKVTFESNDGEEFHIDGEDLEHIKHISVTGKKSKYSDADAKKLTSKDAEVKPKQKGSGRKLPDVPIHLLDGKPLPSVEPLEDLIDYKDMSEKSGLPKMVENRIRDFLGTLFGGEIFGTSAYKAAPMEGITFYKSDTYWNVRTSSTQSMKKEVIFNKDQLAKYHIEESDMQQFLNAYGKKVKNPKDKSETKFSLESLANPPSVGSEESQDFMKGLVAYFDKDLVQPISFNSDKGYYADKKVLASENAKVKKYKRLQDDIKSALRSYPGQWKLLGSDVDEDQFVSNTGHAVRLYHRYDDYSGPKYAGFNFRVSVKEK